MTLPRIGRRAVEWTESVGNVLRATARHRCAVPRWGMSLAIRPITRHAVEIVNDPMMRRFAAISISRAIAGTATIPLMAAAHTSARMGLISKRLAPAPRNVAAVIVA